MSSLPLLMLIFLLSFLVIFYYYSDGVMASKKKALYMLCNLLIASQIRSRGIGGFLMHVL